MPATEGRFRILAQRNPSLGEGFFIELVDYRTPPLDIPHEIPHAREMRSFPEYASARAAATEAVERGAGAVLDAVEDISLGDVLEKPVAFHAAGKRGETSREVEAADNLERLLSGILVPNPVAVGHGTGLEEAAVAGADVSALGEGDLDDRAVGVIGAIERIETEETEVPREAAKVHVKDEPALAERNRAKMRDGRDVKALELRIDRRAVAVAEPIGKIDRHAVDEDQVYLAVRNADRLDRVLYRGVPEKTVFELDPCPTGREKIVELLVEAKCRAIRPHASPPLQLLAPRGISSIAWPCGDASSTGGNALSAPVYTDLRRRYGSRPDVNSVKTLDFHF